MKNIYVGELRPRQVNDDEDDQVQVLSNSNVQDDTNQASSSGSDDNVQVQQVTSKSSQPNDQASASNQVPILQPTNIARDHPLNTIIEDIFRGVQTRSKLALFCEHFSFVLFIEPEKIEEALRDVDWVNAMHEKLNNFTRNQVWELVERPKNHNVIGTKWVFRNKQDQDGIVVRNKARLVAQVILKLTVLTLEKHMPRLLDWKQLGPC
jgi:hypothetical protein